MLDFTRREGSAALAFLVAGTVWFVVGASYGLLDAIHLAAPEFFNNFGPLAFGRMRPIHVDTVLFGFVTTTLIGCGLYYVPAMLKVALWSEPLGWLSALLWNLTILSGPLTFSFGLSQGREYAEYLWIFDVSLVLSLLVMFFNIAMTIRDRREPTLFVGVWYFVGMLMWTAFFYPIGNVMWRPATGSLPGLLDSVLLWMYGHNLPGLLLTPLALGAAYFVIPRVTRTPIFSHTLSHYGFWTLVALYSHIGGHHILQAPIPNWLKVMSVVDSWLMVIPVFAVLINLWLTARGRGGRLLADPAGRFVIAGTVFYLLTCLQGPFQSTVAVQRITHFNNWTIGHSHLAVLGFAGFIALGGLWHILPLIVRRRLYAPLLVNLQFGLISLGLVGFIVILTIVGLIQGQDWSQGATVLAELPSRTPYMIGRAVVGTGIVLGAYLGLYVLIMTMLKGEPLLTVRGREPDR
jgi:cbb3-type cytochrome c oxidase subunit I